MRDKSEREREMLYGEDTALMAESRGDSNTLQINLKWDLMEHCWYEWSGRNGKWIGRRWRWMKRICLKSLGVITSVDWSMREGKLHIGYGREGIPWRFYKEDKKAVEKIRALYWRVLTWTVVSGCESWSLSGGGKNTAKNVTESFGMVGINDDVCKLDVLPEKITRDVHKITESKEMCI